MHCSHCRSMMFEAEFHKDSQTEQTRYECPTCGRSHLYSRCVSGYETQSNQREKYLSGSLAAATHRK